MSNCHTQCSFSLQPPHNCQAIIGLILALTIQFCLAVMTSLIPSKEIIQMANLILSVLRILVSTIYTDKFPFLTMLNHTGSTQVSTQARRLKRQE